MARQRLRFTDGGAGLAHPTGHLVEPPEATAEGASIPLYRFPTDWDKARLKEEVKSRVDV